VAGSPGLQWEHQQSRATYQAGGALQHVHAEESGTTEVTTRGGVMQVHLGNRLVIKYPVMSDYELPPEQRYDTCLQAFRSEIAAAWSSSWQSGR
jgi:hypothetical protein